MYNLLVKNRRCLTVLLSLFWNLKDLLLMKHHWKTSPTNTNHELYPCHQEVPNKVIEHASLSQVFGSMMLEGFLFPEKRVQNVVYCFEKQVKWCKMLCWKITMLSQQDTFSTDKQTPMGPREATYTSKKSNIASPLMCGNFAHQKSNRSPIDRIWSQSVFGKLGEALGDTSRWLRLAGWDLRMLDIIRVSKKLRFTERAH